MERRDVKAQKEKINPMQADPLLDGEREHVLIKRHFPSSRRGFLPVSVIPLVARAEPSMSVQEENKKEIVREATTRSKVGGTPAA